MSRPPAPSQTPTLIPTSTVVSTLRFFLEGLPPLLARFFFFFFVLLTAAPVLWSFTCLTLRSCQAGGGGDTEGARAKVREHNQREAALRRRALRGRPESAAHEGVDGESGGVGWRGRPQCASQGA